MPEVTTPGENSAPQVTILPGRVDRGASSQAVDELLKEGWILYEQSRHDASISVAERALRIDRYRPELYLLLSRNYLATLQLQQAEQLARQGLSMSSITAGQRRQLERLLQEILDDQ